MRRENCGSPGTGHGKEVRKEVRNGAQEDPVSVVARGRLSAVEERVGRVATPPEHLGRTATTKAEHRLRNRAIGPYAPFGRGIQGI